MFYAAFFLSNSIVWVKTHKIIKLLFSRYIWDIPSSEKVVYLTFDDGPIPEITEWVLEQLKRYDAKATFFCIGQNVDKNPGILEKVIRHGHTIGNHTHNHLNGWNSNKSFYLDNVAQCNETLQKNGVSTSLFRPPYGKIGLSQARRLRKQGYKIIMWDIVSYDFDERLSAEKCLQNVLQNIRPGSIIVFHDSIKAFKNLEYVLPKTLEYLKNNGYLCKALD